MYCFLSNDVFKKRSISRYMCIWMVMWMWMWLCQSVLVCRPILLSHSQQNTAYAPFDVVVWSRETATKASACETPTSKHRVEMKMYYIKAACMYVKTIDLARKHRLIFDFVATKYIGVGSIGRSFGRSVGRIVVVYACERV